MKYQVKIKTLQNLRILQCLHKIDIQKVKP
jgi:hypothetical protein